MILETFSDVVDFRRAQGKMYDLQTVLDLATIARLSGAFSYRKIHTFIVGRYDELKEKYNITWKKIPSFSCIRFIILGANTHSMHEGFKKDAAKKLMEMKKLKEMNKEDELLVFSSDGKGLLGSYDHSKGVRAIQDLSIYSNDYNLIMAIEKIDEKTNEIPAAQRLIPELGIKGAIFTFDAMNCQFKTLDILVESGNDVIVQVKGNQEVLLNDCQRIAASCEPTDEFIEGLEKGHGRITDRKVSVYGPELITNLHEKWGNVINTIKVERFRLLSNTKKNNYEDDSGVSYYISTKSLTAEQYNSIIRGHWSIENKNHYVRDVAMKEDKSRIRVKPQNMAIILSLALNILRYNGVKNIENRLYENTLSFKRLLELKM
mgnify:FL=1